MTADLLIVSQTPFGDHLSHVMGKDFYRMILGAVVLNFALLCLLFRNIIRSLLAMVPGITGMFVVMGRMGIPWHCRHAGRWRCGTRHPVCDSCLFRVDTNKQAEDGVVIPNFDFFRVHQ